MSRNRGVISLERKPPRRAEGPVDARAQTVDMTKGQELIRYPAPGGLPQPLAFHGETLYVGSRDASRLDGLDPATGKVVDGVQLPGPPFGLVSHAGALHVVVSIGEGDDRYMYRYTPGQPFDAKHRIELPERNGSTLASDAQTLYLVQMTNARIVALGQDGAIERAFALPVRIAGACFHEGVLYCIAADEEFERLEFATLQLDASPATVTPVTQISPDARSLAYGAGAWWTNYRDRNEIVSLSIS